MSGLLALPRKLWKSARLRILAMASIMGIVCGFFMVGVPLEDAFYAGRSLLQLQPASGQIAVVMLDDRTLRELDEADVPRDLDAQLIDKVLEAGARHIYFDRSYKFAGAEGEDAVLVDALRRWPGQVSMGSIPNASEAVGTRSSNVPHPKFQPYVGVVSLFGKRHPFALGISFPFYADTPMGRVPSLSAALAGLNTLPDGDFLPRYAIDYRTIPSYSYIDILRGKFSRTAFEGKDIVVAPAASNFNDLHQMPGRGYVQGAYFHVIAAETLRQGVPLRAGWLPLLVAAMAIVATGIGRGQTIDRYRISGLAAVLLIVPFILDRMNIQFEVFPAAAAAAFAIFRARVLDRVEAAVEVNAISGLPSLQMLRNNERTKPGILVALKIRNYSGIIGSFADHVESQLAHEIVRRIRISDRDVSVYHEAGMFMWFSTITNPLDLCENIEGLHRIVQNGIQVGGIDIDMGFNCGIDAEADRPVASRLASAMQSAEEAVRNDELVCVYESGKHEAKWEISLLTSLDRAIDNGEVWVAYQPKLDLSSGRISGAEALVRWTHPERGPISPEKFIGIAEEYHRIERITRFVINDAVRSAVALARLDHDLTISVNISAQLLRNPGLPGMISEILAAHRLAPEKLILEITETDRLDRSSRTFQMLRQLVDMGMKLSIDDFGTGNATIDYLRYLPAQEVKIDKTFVSVMETSREDYLLVQSIIEMAHSLKREVVAEGVETRGVFEQLRAMGCDTIQGYLISPAVPFRDLVNLIGVNGERRLG